MMSAQSDPTAGGRRSTPRLVSAPFLARLAGVITLLVFALTWSIAPAWRSLRDTFRPHAVADDLMAPAVPLGALVVTERVASGDLQPNDIILYQHPERNGDPMLIRVTKVDAPQALRGPGKVLTLRRDSPAVPEVWEAELHGAAWRLRVTLPYLAPFASITRWLPTHLSWQGILLFVVIATTFAALRRRRTPSPPDPRRG